MPGNGSAQLRVIAAHCKAAGSRGLLNRTRATIRVEAQPLVAAAKQEALARLPKSGGLNRQVASQRWTVSVLTGARTAGVRLRTKAPDTDQSDEGFVRHPTFGRRGAGDWRRQDIPQAKGWASDTVQKYGPALAASMVRQLDAAAAEIARAAGGS